MWRRLGADVTVIEFLDRITPGVDDEITRHLPAHARQAGPEVQARLEGDQGRANGEGVTLTVEPAKGGAAETVEADIVLV